MREVQGVKGGEKGRKDDGITCGLSVLLCAVPCIAPLYRVGNTFIRLSSFAFLFSLGFPFPAIDQSDGFGLIWLVWFVQTWPAE
jgi:hypothetical protein